jgi:Zn-dependent M28 family amino/carboxypeptidase
LTSWNRYSYGSQIHQSKDYIVSELKKIGNFDIKLENYTQGSTKLWNIIAELKGTEKPDEIYIVAGHLDSTSNSPNTAAPGAVDDASGSASVLEIARIFIKYPPKHTMQFIWYTFEEQGLIGSTFSANALVRRGDKDKVKLMLQQDMTGYKSPSNPLKVLVETDSKYSDIVKVFQTCAAKYCDGLQTAVSYRPFGSDHVPYIRYLFCFFLTCNSRGMPGVLTIDNDYGRYPHYHRTTDLPQYVVVKMGEEIVKMNVAVLATMMKYE